MLQETVYKFDGGNSLGNSSDYFSFAFGAAKEPVGDKIGLVHGVHSCREGLFSNMRRRICDANSSQPTDKMRMLFVWRLAQGAHGRDNLEVDGWIDRAIPIIQAADKMAGWPLTRIHAVDANTPSARVYYFHSSRRWMKSSYLVSLYTLLVRMAKDKRFVGIKNYEDLIKILDDSAKKADKLTIDHTYVMDSYPYWEALLKGYPRLFRQRKMPYYWDTKRLDGSSGGSEGIQYLVKGHTQYGEIRKELLVIKKEIETKKFK